MDLIVVKELATLDVITVSAEDDLDMAMKKIGYRNIEQLPVVSKDDDRKLVGIISVITSYSIHYTKLYDRCPSAGPRRDHLAGQ